MATVFRWQPADQTERVGWTSAAAATALAILAIAPRPWRPPPRARRRKQGAEVVVRAKRVRARLGSATKAAAIFASAFVLVLHVGAHRSDPRARPIASVRRERRAVYCPVWEPAPPPPPLAARLKSFHRTRVPTQACAVSTSSPLSRAAGFPHSGGSFAICTCELTFYSKDTRFFSFFCAPRSRKAAVVLLLILAHPSTSATCSLPALRIVAQEGRLPRYAFLLKVKPSLRRSVLFLSWLYVSQ